MVVSFLAFRSIRLSSPLSRMLLLVWMMLFLPTVHFLRGVFACVCRCINVSTPLSRRFRWVLTLLLRQILNFLPVWLALSLVWFRLTSRLPMMFILWFFFSSRRRHTRFDCDWSSDVCSSDLLSRSERRVDPLSSMTAALIVVTVTLAFAVWFLMEPPWVPGI